MLSQNQIEIFPKANAESKRPGLFKRRLRHSASEPKRRPQVTRPHSTHGRRRMKKSESTRGIPRPQTASAEYLPTLPSDKPVHSLWRSKSASFLGKRRSVVRESVSASDVQGMLVESLARSSSDRLRGLPRPHSAAVVSRAKKRNPPMRPKSRPTSSWKSLHVPRPSQLSESTKVLNHLQDVVRKKREIEPRNSKGGVPPEQQFEFIGETGPSFKKLVEVLPQNDTNAKMVAILQDYEALATKLNRNCIHGRKQIANLQRKNNQLYQSNEKLLGECVDIQRVMSPKSSESIAEQDNARKRAELEEELTEREEKYESTCLDLKVKISKLTMQIQELLEGSMPFITQRIEGLFKSETPSRHVLVYDISPECSDAELRGGKKAFLWEKCFGRFPGNVHLTRNACFYSFLKEEDAMNMVQVKLSGDSKACFAREQPCCEVTIASPLTEDFIQTWFAPFGRIRNWIRGEFHTIIKFDNLKSACASIVFLSGRRIKDEVSNKYIIMNMDFANDTRHMEEKWRFQTEEEEEMYLKTQGKDDANIVPAVDQHQISDFNIDDYEDKNIELEIPEEAPPAVATWTREELNKELDHLRQNLQGEAARREGELMKEIRDLNYQCKQKDEMYRDNCLHLEEERERYLQLETRKNILDSKKIRDLEERKDQSELLHGSVAHVRFLESQIEKLRIDRDRLDAQLFPSGADKLDSCVGGASVPVMQRELSHLKKEVSQLRRRLEKRDEKIRDLQNELAIYKSEMSKRALKSPGNSVSSHPRDVDSLNKEERELLNEIENLREQLSSLEVSNAKERSEISQKLEESDKKLHLVEEEIKHLRAALKLDITKADMDLAKLNGSPDGGLDRCASAELYSLHDRLAQKIKEERRQTLIEHSTALESKKSNDRLVAELKEQLTLVTRELTELKAKFDSQVQKACQEQSDALFERSGKRLELEGIISELREKLMEFERKQEVFGKLEGLIGDDGTPSSIGQTQRIMMDTMKDRDEALLKFLALENDFKNMQEMSRKNESIFEQTKEKLRQEIVELKSQIRKMINEMTRVRTAERGLEEFEREVRVEEMFESRKKSSDLDRPPSRSRTLERYEYNAPVTDPATDRKRLIKLIEHLKEKNRKLDRESQKLKLTMQAKLREEFIDLSPKGKFRHAVSTVIKHKSDSILRIGVSQNPPPKEKREIESKWKMTQSRFLKIMKGEPSKRPLKAKRWLQRTISEIYDRKRAADLQARRENLPLIALPDFIYHEYIPSRFGLTELVDVMCWDIHHAVEKYGPEDREIRTFKKFLEEAFPTRALSFYLHARDVVLKIVKEHDSNYISSVLFRRAVVSVFYNTSAAYQDDLAERLEFEALYSLGTPQLEAHTMLEIIVDEYTTLRKEFKTQTLRLFFHMGLHNREVVEFEDYLPCIRVILAGVPEEKVQQEIERLRMPTTRTTPIQQFIALTDRFSDLRLQFVLSEASAELEGAKDADVLFKHVDSHWRSFEADVLKQLLPKMSDLTTPYEHLDEIRFSVNTLKDLSKHLNVALLHHSVWDSFRTYCLVLCEVQSLFHAFDLNELRKTLDLKCARALLGPLEEIITCRFNRILKKVRANSNSEIHMEPHYVINSEQYSSVDADTAAHRKMLKRFATSLSSPKFNQKSPKFPNSQKGWKQGKFKGPKMKRAKSMTK